MCSIKDKYKHLLREKSNSGHIFDNKAPVFVNSRLFIYLPAGLKSKAKYEETPSIRASDVSVPLKPPIIPLVPASANINIQPSTTTIPSNTTNQSNVVIPSNVVLPANRLGLGTAGLASEVAEKARARIARLSNATAQPPPIGLNVPPPPPIVEGGGFVVLKRWL